MTINEYISQKFQSFGINLSEADLLDMCLNAEISGEDEMNEDCYGRVFVAIAKFIPSLSLRADSWVPSISDVFAEDWEIIQ